jgi:integrase
MARARSFGSIRKLPSGKYQARYWHLGKQISADHTFVAKTDARRWLSTVEADMVRGDWVDPDAGKITFGEYADWWIEQRPARPRTKQIYEGQLKHITPTFAGVSLRDIRPVDVRGWHGELSRGSLHQNTIAKIYRLFRTILSTAVEDDLLRQNPVRIKGASAEQMIERPLLTWDDVRALAGAIQSRFECLVWTAAASGLRFGELAGLSVDHVNVDRSELRVSQALNDIKGVGPTLGPPKTDRAVRTVAIPESIALRLVVPHRAVRRRVDAGCTRVHLAARWPAPQHLLRSALVEGAKRGRAPPCALPRPAPPRRDRGSYGRSVTPRGDGDDGPRIERRKPPLPQSVREPRTRDR